MQSHAASQLAWESGALLERTRLARRLAGTGAECGFPAAELLPAVSLVVAGRDQGGVPRPCQHRRAVRPRRAEPELRDSAAERGIAEVVRQADDASGLHAVQPAQGQSDAAAGADVSAATPVRPDGASIASQRATVPAELSAR